MLAILAFIVFAADQAKAASGTQQQAIKAATASTTTSLPAAPAAPQQNGFHKALDEVSETFTAPFEAVVPESSGEWARRGGGLLLVLAVYGFGVGYVLRYLRVRV
jgi:hypothetical protein